MPNFNPGLDPEDKREGMDKVKPPPNSSGNMGNTCSLR